MSLIKSPRFWSTLALIASILCIAAVVASIMGVRMDTMGFRTASTLLRRVVIAGAGVFAFSIFVLLLGRKHSGAVKTSLTAAVLALVPVIGIAINQPAGTGLSALSPPNIPQGGMGAPAGGTAAPAMGAPAPGGIADAMGAAAMGGGAPGRTPPLNDISTDTQDPPLYSVIVGLRPEGSNTVEYPGPAAARTQQQLFPDIAPINSSLAKAEAFERAVQVANKMGWEIVAQDASTGIIEAVSSTPFFSFEDDVVIRVAEGNAGSVVDIRSHSRIGRGDRGKNAERVRHFIKAFGS